MLMIKNIIQGCLSSKSTCLPLANVPGLDSDLVPLILGLAC